MDEDLTKTIDKALTSGDLVDTAEHNLRSWLDTDGLCSWASDSIEQLIRAGEWREINDRFHNNLAFGTGGIRGRTIGRFLTDSERGRTKGKSTPEYAAVGSNTLNDYTVVRATMALHGHISTWMASEGILDVPRIVIAHDVRHFSRHFCELAASTWSALGGYAMIFDGPRPTPQLSFTVRKRYAHAGVVITASHNPPHDNGFKVYFVDGAQVVPPHAESIVDRYSKLTVQDTIPFVVPVRETEGSPFTILPAGDDLAYRAALEETVLDAELLKEHCPKIVFTPIHGTGGMSAIPSLWDHGAEVVLVDEQAKPDPNFSTVKSPNPESPEALKQGISLARKVKAKAVLASDPDGDRIGLAVFNGKDRFECLTGNQVGCMLSEYRISKLKKQGVIPEAGSPNAVILKTFVTTPMMEAIAIKNGIRCVNTLTGFKWISEKIGDYEDLATTALRENEGIAWDYDNTDFYTRAEILLRYSKFTVFAGEESVGYLPLDTVRDKDGNAAALACAELLAHLELTKSSPLEYLEYLYLKYGYFEEQTVNLYFEGVKGSEIIKKIIRSYSKNEPTKINDVAVTKVRDFGKQGYLDEDGKPVPVENFFIFELEDAFSIAVRASGTEPKIKYYLFGRSQVVGKNDLSATKSEVGEKLNFLADWANKDAHERGEVETEGKGSGEKQD
jgi:phosphoglucomutase